MTYGTIFPSRQMIASLSLVRMSVSSLGRPPARLRFPFSRPHSGRERGCGEESPAASWDYWAGLIAALMAPYSRCALSLAVPAEAGSSSGPSARITAAKPDSSRDRSPPSGATDGVPMKPGAVGRMRDAEPTGVLQQSHVHLREKVIAHSNKLINADYLLEQQRGEHALGGGQFPPPRSLVPVLCNH